MFYNKILSVYSETEIKNEIGQIIKSYQFLNDINCDIQPSTVNIIQKTFGQDIESLFIVFCNEDLKLGTVVKFNNIVCKINNKIDWIDYKIYSIIGVDILC